MPLALLINAFCEGEIFYAGIIITYLLEQALLLQKTKCNCKLCISNSSWDKIFHCRENKDQEHLYCLEHHS